MGNELDLLTNLRHWVMRRCSAEMELAKTNRRGNRAKTEAEMARCLSRMEIVEDQLADIEASAPDVPEELIAEATAVADEVLEACSVDTSAGVVRNLSALGYSQSEIGYALIGRGSLQSHEQAVRNVHAHQLIMRRKAATESCAPEQIPEAAVTKADKVDQTVVDKTGLIGLLYEAVRQTVMRWQENNA